MYIFVSENKFLLRCYLYSCHVYISSHMIVVGFEQSPCLNPNSTLKNESERVGSRPNGPVLLLELEMPP